MLAGLLLTVPCADVREVTIFGAAGLRSGATSIVGLPSGKLRSRAHPQIGSPRRKGAAIQIRHDHRLVAPRRRDDRWSATGDLGEQIRGLSGSGGRPA